MTEEERKALADLSGENGEDYKKLHRDTLGTALGWSMAKWGELSYEFEPFSAFLLPLKETNPQLYADASKKVKEYRNAIAADVLSAVTDIPYDISSLLNTTDAITLDFVEKMESVDYNLFDYFDQHFMDSAIQYTQDLTVSLYEGAPYLKKAFNLIDSFPPASKAIDVLGQLNGNQYIYESLRDDSFKDFGQAAMEAGVKFFELNTQGFDSFEDWKEMGRLFKDTGKEFRVAAGTDSYGLISGTFAKNLPEIPTATVDLAWQDYNNMNWESVGDVLNQTPIGIPAQEFLFQPGESYEDMAQRFRETVGLPFSDLPNQLALEANALLNYNLLPATELPVPAPPSPEEYDKIKQQFDISWQGGDETVLLEPSTENNVIIDNITINAASKDDDLTELAKRAADLIVQSTLEGLSSNYTSGG